jgi:glycosyltransferase involved in cell wall biosynthesis
VRVGYELTSLELDSSGSARYVNSLRSELERRDDIQLVPLAQSRSHFGHGSTRVLRGLARELIYFPLRLPRQARELELDLLHCPAPLAPVRSSVPIAVTVHDVATREHPEWFSRANVLQQRLVLTPALRRAALVITGSRYSRSKLVRLVGLDPERVVVTPFGVDERFTPGRPSEELLGWLHVPLPYVLTVGTLQPRKNVESVLLAFERLASRGAEHHLAVVGARGWLDEALVARLQRPSLAKRIRVTGRVSDDELVALYRGADCLVFPSRYEGFGFPPLEAMACGTPVISSNRTSLPEIVGDAGWLVDPDDARAVEDALEILLTSADRRRQCVERGLRRAAEFTWQKCADLTVSAYRDAIALT